MYVPNAFRLDDRESILTVMRQYAFATLVSTVEGAPFATHLPLLTAAEGDRTILRGHLARNNLHATYLEAGPALAIFAGPHAYVSPRFYVSTSQVPTWNYVTVHAYGNPRVLHDEGEIDAHLREMVLTFDPQIECERPDSVAPDLLARLRRGVVVFEILIDRLEGKAKLSQNKSEEDRAGVIANLGQTEDRVTAEWMTRLGGTQR